MTRQASADCEEGLISSPDLVLAVRGQKKPRDLGTRSGRDTRGPSSPFSCTLTVFIFSVEQRIVFKINLITHKVMNGTAPHYLQELLNRYEPLRRLRSSGDKWRFAIRRYSQETYGRRAFAIMAPKLWNKLPLELRSISKSNIFKSNLKTYLFKLAYDL